MEKFGVKEGTRKAWKMDLKKYFILMGLFFMKVSIKWESA
jgi:hypothetical protein